MTLNTKKAVTALISAVLFFVLERYCLILTAIPNVRISFGYPLLTFISTILGPVFGGCAGGIGLLLLQWGQESLDWISVGCAFVYFASIGAILMGMDVVNGFFERKEMTLYNQTQWMTGFAVFILLRPALSYFLLKTPFNDMLTVGFWQNLSCSLSNMLMGTLFLAVYARSRITPANFCRN